MRLDFITWIDTVCHRARWSRADLFFQVPIIEILNYYEVGCEADSFYCEVIEDIVNAEDE